MESASSGGLEVVLHVIGLHVERDEPILHQVPDGVKWLLTWEGGGVMAIIYQQNLFLFPDDGIAKSPLTDIVALLLSLIVQPIVSHLTSKPVVSERENRRGYSETL